MAPIVKIFTPTVELKEELANTSIVITCYDRTMLRMMPGAYKNAPLNIRETRRFERIAEHLFQRQAEKVSLTTKPTRCSSYDSFSVSSTFSCNSSSCLGSSSPGASSMTSRPLLFFGKAMQSRMLSRPAMRLTKRSRPKARPA